MYSINKLSAYVYENQKISKYFHASQIMKL